MSTVHRGLDVPTVVRTSLAIADAEGLDGLTMRRLASELDVTPMAIYHHVKNKEQLLDLVVDESLKELPAVDIDAPWTEELKRFFLGFHRLYLDHPTLAYLMAQRPLEGPTAVTVAERVLTLLVQAGLDDDQAAAALVTLLNFTIGTSLYRLSRTRHGDDQREQRFSTIPVESAPITYRLRHKMADAAVNEDHFVDGLSRLIESYASPRGPAAKPARRPSRPSGQRQSRKAVKSA